MFIVNTCHLVKLLALCRWQRFSIKLLFSASFSEISSFLEALPQPIYTILQSKSSILFTTDWSWQEMQGRLSWKHVSEKSKYASTLFVVFAVGCCLTSKCRLQYPSVPQNWFESSQWTQRDWSCVYFIIEWNHISHFLCSRFPFCPSSKAILTATIIIVHYHEHRLLEFQTKLLPLHTGPNHFWSRVMPNHSHCRQH